MQKNSLLLILFLSLSGCYQVERNCTDFHTGTYEFEQIVGDKLLRSTFIRTDSLEVEFFEDKIDSASIRWVNDCECILTKLNPETNQDKRPISIRIVSTSKKDYVFEYALVGNSKKKQRGTITKISDSIFRP